MTGKYTIKRWKGAIPLEKIKFIVPSRSKDCQILPGRIHREMFTTRTLMHSIKSSTLCEVRSNPDCHQMESRSHLTWVIAWIYLREHCMMQKLDRMEWFVLKHTSKLLLDFINLKAMR
jgi:hypothetical protein